MANEVNQPGSTGIVDIWAYQPDDIESVVAKSISVGREMPVGVKSGTKISTGTLLTVSLYIQCMEIEDSVMVIDWQGDVSNASFFVKIPEQVRPGRYQGKAVISCVGMQVAKIVFLFSVSELEAVNLADVVGIANYSKTAFASYASENRDEVMARIQGMQVVMPRLDIFLDVLSLRSGQYWLAELEKNIATREVFYLFWSPQAAASEWVEKEWRLALEMRGLDYICPVPLAEPEKVPPPSELAELHFNDAWLSYIEHHS